MGGVTAVGWDTGGASDGVQPPGDTETFEELILISF